MMTGKAFEKEWAAVLKKEEKMRQKAVGQKKSEWKEGLEKKIPEKARHGLEKAFIKAFELVFTKGTSVIEKSYQKADFSHEHKIRDFAIRERGKKKDFGALRNTVRKSEAANTIAAFAEGVGLGVLGIGLPDVVLFVGMLFRGIYQIATKYGFDYEDDLEKMFILKVMETSLQKGEAWVKCDDEVEIFLQDVVSEPSKEDLKNQMEQTANVFAMDMLVMKFVQSFPIVGVAGGISNPYYYRKIMDYAEVKYWKRYLQKIKETSRR